MKTLEKNKKTPPSATTQNFPIVGIGSSAGGLDAFKRLLKAIPEDSGMAYVLVQHLDPNHESILPEILQRVTKIPVHEITDDIHLTPDHIYIIPSNKTLTSTDGVLKLTARNRKIQNLAIDIFFTSLAHVHKEFAVGVVLSGTGTDGTLGLKAIKEYGGVTIAQDKETATYDSMPLSAVNAGVVDFILAPENIPDQLLHMDRKKKPQDLKKKAGKELKEDDIFKQILSLLKVNSGVDFTYYKQPTPLRRIARRMGLRKETNLSKYFKFLQGNKVEQNALFQDMLIPVTSFFRDPEMFASLAKTSIPQLLKNRLPDHPIRVWIAGCSTGEEAYSIAMCLDECLNASAKSEWSKTRIQIFASDISEAAIKKARTGIYTKAEIHTISDKRIKNYFTKNNSSFEVNKLIRDMCVFAPHNFLKDPPFAKMDLVSCRNVLIYMDTFLQKKAFTTFHYALKENGILILGKSESTGASSDLFTPLGKQEKIYMRKSVPGLFIHVPLEPKKETASTKKDKKVSAEVPQTDFRKSAESILLSGFTPAGVIVNEQLDIVHIHGAIAPFLEQSPGKPTFNLLKMAGSGLAFELRNAIHKAKVSQHTVIKTGIPGLRNDAGELSKQRLINIQVIPIPNIVESHFLVLFTKTELPVAVSGKKIKESPELQKVNREAEVRIQQIELELAQTREDMRSITEDQEAANEELQSANEELLSSSEEMQSLNEELETSKEELQSTNEELIIVNHELIDKQELLNASRFYSEAIITTMREPLVVLDRLLRIKTANASFYKKFNVDEQETEDQLFYEIQNHQFDNAQLRSLLEKILPQKKRIDDFEIKLEFPSVGERTLLLNAQQIVNAKTAEQLILLAIEDVTERRLVEEKLKTFAQDLETEVVERTRELQQTNDQLQQFAYITSHDLQEPLRKILTFSSALREKHAEELTEGSKFLLNKIETSSMRMSNLIQDVLNYSHLMNYEKLFVDTNLNETLDDILNDFDLLIEQKKAKIKIDVLPIISAVPMQMYQLFSNLLSNSLKFSKEGVAPLIHITTGMLSKKEMAKYPTLSNKLSYVEIIFRDNGIGFEQDYAEKIFVIFQRLHSKQAYIGTGIGLALNKKIAENHHGLIFAKSNATRGASFHVILPKQQPIKLKTEGIN
ncbi:MAG: chemotaxis protein CheB [Bacteroidota bacterium]